ncbi:MAG: UTRA domain-containing protein, partial [Firmicutes bacterium]|nr:UTRA domain-containing protein [Bacillota bacterium]
LGLNFQNGAINLCAVIGQEYGVEVVRAEQTLYAVATTPQQAEMLGASPGSPAFRLVVWNTMLPMNQFRPR